MRLCHYGNNWGKHLYVPKCFPDAGRRSMSNSSIRISFTITFGTWFTDRRVFNTGLEYQFDIGSTQDVNSPNDLTAAHQTANKTAVPNKTNKVAIFVELDVRRYFVAIDGVRYLTESVNVDYAANYHFTHYRDLKLNDEEYVGAELVDFFITYNDMKNVYPIQCIDLRFKVDQKNLRKIQLFPEYQGAKKNARLFVIIFSDRKIGMISDGHKITVEKVVENDNIWNKRLFGENFWKTILWLKVICKKFTTGIYNQDISNTF